MLDPPLKLGKEDTQENAALAKVLESWGVTLDKDLASTPAASARSSD